MTELGLVAVIAAFTTGLMSGVHCAPMCGAVVQVVARGAPAGGRPLRHQLAYNGGRIASYSVAGGLAGAMGQGALAWHGAGALQLIFLLMAMVMLLGVGLQLAGYPSFTRAIEAQGARLWRHLQPLAKPLLPTSTAARALAFGALMGWLPCGLVYSMLIVALTTGGALSGALVMLAFGLGTLPSLLAASWALGRMRQLPARAWPRRFAAAVLVVGGLSLPVLVGSHTGHGTSHYRDDGILGSVLSCFR
jgi:sulfite exporter TauE/SafE